MAIPCNTPDLENRKFVEHPDGSGEVAVRTLVANDSTQPIPVLSTALAGNPTIYNIVVTANTITSQLLNDGTRQFLIRPRDTATVDFSFDNALTSFIRVTKGRSFTVGGLDLETTTLYFRSTKDTTIEILEWSAN